MRPPEAHSLPEAATYLVERRRPGRRSAHPALLPLLRQPEAASPGAERAAEALEDGHALDPARGIVVGLLMSVPLWAIIVLVVRVLL